jgi:hypothetical protein
LSDHAPNAPAVRAIRRDAFEDEVADHGYGKGCRRAPKQQGGAAEMAAVFGVKARGCAPPSDVESAPSPMVAATLTQRATLLAGESGNGPPSAERIERPHLQDCSFPER